MNALNNKPRFMCICIWFDLTRGNKVDFNSVQLLVLIDNYSRGRHCRPSTLGLCHRTLTWPSRLKRGVGRWGSRLALGHATYLLGLSSLISVALLSISGALRVSSTQKSYNATLSAPWSMSIVLVVGHNFMYSIDRKVFALWYNNLNDWLYLRACYKSIILVFVLKFPVFIFFFFNYY